MINEQARLYIEDLEKRLAAIERYLTQRNPAWNMNVTIIPVDGTPDYLWRDQPVTYVSPIKGGDEPLAWVKIGTGEPIIAAVRELKPMRGEA